jgi:hypothetical protein
MILHRPKHRERVSCVKVDAIERSNASTLLGTNDRRIAFSTDLDKSRVLFEPDRTAGAKDPQEWTSDRIFERSFPFLKVLV